MTNYKIVVQYDGTRYNGWQKQGNTKNTIQEKFEDILFKMTDKKTEIFASGRTDAGVHAWGQVANFKIDCDMPCDEVFEYLNNYLPEDIAVISVEKAEDRFHSRLNATSKTYEYRMTYKKPDVFKRKYIYTVEKKPDIDLMKKGAEILTGTYDFKGFSSLGRTKKSTIRTINFIDIEDDFGVIKIRINGSGFLYNMVRIIAGTLYDIGTGKKDIEDIKKALESKSREFAGTTFPARGLALVEVKYDFL